MNLSDLQNRFHEAIAITAHRGAGVIKTCESIGKELQTLFKKISSAAFKSLQKNEFSEIKEELKQAEKTLALLQTSALSTLDRCQKKNRGQLAGDVNHRAVLLGHAADLQLLASTFLNAQPEDEDLKTQLGRFLSECEKTQKNLVNGINRDLEALGESSGVSEKESKVIEKKAVKTNGEEARKSAEQLTVAVMENEGVAVPDSAVEMARTVRNYEGAIRALRHVLIHNDLGLSRELVLSGVDLTNRFLHEFETAPLSSEVINSLIDGFQMIFKQNLAVLSDRQQEMLKKAVLAERGKVFELAAATAALPKNPEKAKREIGNQVNKLIEDAYSLEYVDAGKPTGHSFLAVSLGQAHYVVPYANETNSSENRELRALQGNDWQNLSFNAIRADAHRVRELIEKGFTQWFASVDDDVAAQLDRLDQLVEELATVVPEAERTRSP